MKRLTCEMCGSTDLIKKDGVFECQSCGCKYSVEEAKKLMVEGVVEVKVTEPVKVDNAEKVSNLYEIARRAKENKNHIQAAKYYDLILQEDPNSWEAQFYSVYFSAMDCKIAEISSASYSVTNCINSTFSILIESVESIQEQEKICNEIYSDLNHLTAMFLQAALNHYVTIDSSIKNRYTLEFNDRAYAIESILSVFAENILNHFDQTIFALKLANKALEGARTVCDTAKAEISRYVLFPEAKAKRIREFNEYSNKISTNEKRVENIELEARLSEECKNINNNKEQFYSKFLEISKKSDSIEELSECVRIFNILGDYSDSRQQVTLCKERIAEIQKDEVYKNAVSLKKQGKYKEAIETFNSINEYKDSKELSNQCQNFLNEFAENQRVSKEKKKRKIKMIAIAVPSVIALVTALAILLVAIVIPKAKFKEIVVVSTGVSHTIGLKYDGTVVATGDGDDGQCDVSGWKDIVAISAGAYHTVGLKSDGTVIAVGYNGFGQCDVSDWKDIVAISAGPHTVGLKSDGTVVAIGNDDFGQCDVSGWTDIVAISVGGRHTVGLKSHGTVIAVGKNDYGQCDISNWKDIVAISAGDYHTVGLKSDGTVVAVGDNDYDQCDVSGWKDIVAISAGAYHTVGLKSDGTVVAVGRNWKGTCEVNNWMDIVTISAGSSHTVGLKSDGTVVAVGYNGYGQCLVGGKK